jgi:predicted nuclease with RNAse H fold
MERWLGVDVGGERKRFDVAVIDGHRLLALESRLDRAAVAQLVDRARPAVVAIDSPCRCAQPGRTCRDSERELARSICGIRWTPDERAIHGSEYYAWVVQGLALFDALAGCGAEAIEVFPTASWTRWLGKRGGRTRVAWTRDGMSALDLRGLPARTNQDQRDAIAAALTARLHDRGLTEAIGEIVVPLRDQDAAC